MNMYKAYVYVYGTYYTTTQKNPYKNSVIIRIWNKYIEAHGKVK